MQARTIVILVVGAAACASRRDSVAPEQPAGWDEAIRLAPARDDDPTPNVTEVTLEARPTTATFRAGQTTSLLGYDGLVPGPLLIAERGSELLVHFKNRTDAPSTVHWHGVRVPNGMDGSEVSQKAVAPGADFDYRFVVPDAGLFWYHSHVDTSNQVGHGLYGALLVRDPDEPPLGDDLVLLLSDIGLMPDGSVEPSDINGALGAYFGREGNTLLVNGRVLPHLRARSGVPQRWRVVNAARARYFQFRVPHARMTRLGSDGGLASSARDVDFVVVSPGERLDLRVLPTEAATTFDVLEEDSNRLHAPTPLHPVPMFTMEIEPAAPDQASPPRVPEPLRQIAPLDVTNAVARDIVLGTTTVNGQTVLAIDGQLGKDAPPIVADVGSTHVWTVKNDTDMDHPFHLHGFFFQAPATYASPLENKDTLNVPARSSVRLVTTFDDRPGMWMVHCHILDHVDMGMMRMLMVQRP